MTVSAVIPTYNRRRYLRRAIDSVHAQSAAVDEIVVVDDGSTDNTSEALEDWYGPAVRVVRQPQTGVAGARWRGIREATGDWIAFLDSDDEWTPNRTRSLLEAAGKVSSKVAWIFGDLRIITDAGSGPTVFESHGLALQSAPQVFDDPLAVQYPFQFAMLQGSFIRRDALVELNCFSEKLRSDDDLLAGFQIASKYPFAAIPDVVGKYFRTSDLSASSVVVNGRYSPDHFRSRMLAFATAVRSGRRRPWAALYAEEARGYCEALAQRGPVGRALAFEQFRFRAVSARSVAFLCAALVGRSGIQAWTRVAEARRRRMFGDSRWTGTPVVNA